MIKLKSLINEKEETDVQFRQEALSILNGVVKYGKKYAKKQKMGGVVGYMFPVGMIDKEYADLYIWLTNEKAGDWIITSAEGKHFFMAPMLSGDTLDNFEKQAKKHQSDFLHELIHYLDRSKRYSPGYVGASARGDYNNPPEFNAYYQEGAEKISKALKAGKISKDFSSFVKTELPKYFDKAFLKNLNDKYRKHLIKRLSDLWSQK